ncbi:hypothetical protein [Streptomyces sp. NPDC058953]|uniref:hypothetical protein n=1 Tax=unclassified Streptomyces TaxID=2593676 RepID=UPI0036B29242
MIDPYEAWRLATLRRDANALAPFIAYATDDETVAREALRLSAEVFTATVADLDAAEDAVAALRSRADDLTPHPHQPHTPAPAEADGQVRDYLDDIRREALGWIEPDWRYTTNLFLSVGLRALLNSRLPCAVREDAIYLHARATTALDLGHRDAALAELARFEELRERHAPRGS